MGSWRLPDVFTLFWLYYRECYLLYALFLGLNLLEQKEEKTPTHLRSSSVNVTPRSCQQSTASFQSTTMLSGLNELEHLRPNRLRPRGWKMRLLPAPTV
jgi:hypothetical protein